MFEGLSDLRLCSGCLLDPESNLWNTDFLATDWAPQFCWQLWGLFGTSCLSSHSRKIDRASYTAPHSELHSELRTAGMVAVVQGYTSLDGLEWLLLETAPLDNNLETLVGSLVLQKNHPCVLLLPILASLLGTIANPGLIARS